MRCQSCQREAPLLAAARFCSRECYEEARRLSRLAKEGDRGRPYRRFRDEQVAASGGCARCGSTHDLLLHHRTRSRERPDLLFEPGNVEVVCRSCHTRIHGREGHFRLPEVVA